MPVFTIEVQDSITAGNIRKMISEYGIIVREVRQEKVDTIEELDILNPVESSG